MKTIEDVTEKALDVIRKEITRESKKIDDTREKYPEDLYGAKASIYASKHEGRIAELQKVLNSFESQSSQLHQIAVMRDRINTLENTLREAVRTLGPYGETGEIDRIRSIQDAPDKVLSTDEVMWRLSNENNTKN